MTCEVEKINGCVHVRGEMTIYGAAHLKEQLFAALAGESDVCLDLSAVSEIDTTGVQLLLLAQQVSVAGGARFALARPSDVMTEALGLLCLGVLTHPPLREAAR